MSKWVYYQGVRENEWISIPASVAAAIERSPRQPVRQTPAERAAATRPKAFANPNSHGYGGPEAPWPFDRRRAYLDGRYRAGVRNALKSDWTASNWKHYAQFELDEIVQNLLAAHVAVEEQMAAEKLELQRRPRTRATSESYIRRSNVRTAYNPHCMFCGNTPCMCDF